MTNTATDATTRLECDCNSCATHAAQHGKTLPLTVEAPTAWLDSIAAKSTAKIRGPRGYSKSFRHNTVQIGHEQNTMANLMRQRTGVTPVNG
jgi:hypothetical protein